MCAARRARERKSISDVTNRAGFGAIFFRIGSRSGVCLRNNGLTITRRDLPEINAVRRNRDNFAAW